MTTPEILAVFKPNDRQTFRVATLHVVIKIQKKGKRVTEEAFSHHENRRDAMINTANLPDGSDYRIEEQHALRIIRNYEPLYFSLPQESLLIPDVSATASRLCTEADGSLTDAHKAALRLRT